MISVTNWSDTFFFVNTAVRCCNDFFKYNDAIIQTLKNNQQERRIQHTKTLSAKWGDRYLLFSQQVSSSYLSKSHISKVKFWLLRGEKCCNMGTIQLCTNNYPFLFFIYRLLSLTLRANWSEPPLNRAHWPPSPSPLTVAVCQVGKSVCVVEEHKNMELGKTYKPYHYLLTLRHFTLNFDNPLEMNSSLLCHHWACWCGAPGQESNA